MAWVSNFQYVSTETQNNMREQCLNYKAILAEPNLAPQVGQ